MDRVPGDGVLVRVVDNGTAGREVAAGDLLCVALGVCVGVPGLCGAKCVGGGGGVGGGVCAVVSVRLVLVPGLVRGARRAVAGRLGLPEHERLERRREGALVAVAAGVAVAVVFVAAKGAAAVHGAFEL